MNPQMLDAEPLLNFSDDQQCSFLSPQSVVEQHGKNRPLTLMYSRARIHLEHNLDWWSQSVGVLPRLMSIYRRYPMHRAATGHGIAFLRNVDIPRRGSAHMAQCSIASTNAPRNTVSPTINRIGLIPTAASSLSCVFIPSALMAITRHQRDRLLPAS